MITRITGVVRSVDGLSVCLDPAPGTGPGVAQGGGAGVFYEVLLPAYLAAGMEASVGGVATFWTYHYLEGQGQGTSFVPRLIGFGSARERQFFELFTTVKGIGNRKALRAMAARPSEIAAMIVARDVKGLQKLPEIGKRLAETVVAELSGKVEPYLDAGVDPVTAAARGAAAAIAARAEVKLAPAAADAVETLVALGESRTDAERLVQSAAERTPGADAGALVAAVIARLGR